MSKKNKIQKQLLRAQIERNAQALASGKTIEQIKQMAQPQAITQSAPENTAQIGVELPKEVAETILIRKDIRLSAFLIAAVIICLFAIYFIDRSNPFLLNLANQIFNILQK